MKQKLSSARKGQRHFAPILPATNPPPGDTAPPANHSPLARRQQVSAACIACRLRKIRCGGKRPTCSECARHSITCEYTTGAAETHSQALKRKYDVLQERLRALESLNQLLQAKPETESLEVYRRIRAQEDAESIVKHVRDGDLLLQLALVPETRLRFQFPYAKTIPQFLQGADNPYLDTTIHEWTARQPSPTTAQSPKSRPAWSNQSPYLKPFQSAVLVDPILSSVKPSTWTNVCANDELMRDLLASYFLCEHMWFTYLNKGLFLEDMASGSSMFCSSLLVNAVLAYACHCHLRIPKRADYWDPFNLAYKFLAEAKRLWDLESRQSKVTTIQAALFLNAVSNLDGVDAIGWQYTLRAIEMASELQLFAKSAETTNTKMQIAREFTAWALFCWQGILSYVMFRPPLIDRPPETSLPHPALSRHWYGDVWVRYPSDQTPSPTHHCHDFKARAELMCIINEIALEYFGRAQPQGARPALENTLKLYDKLKVWYSTLPEPLSASRIVLPSHLKLHMMYHNLLINLFKSLLSSQLCLADMAIFANTVHQTPQEAIWTATVYLETLFRIYYLRHGFDAMDAYLVHFLNTLGFMAMDELKKNSTHSLENDRRGLLLMCALGLREQGQYYYLVRTIFHLFRSSMSLEDVALLKTYVQDRNPEKDELHRPEDLISEYPLNILNISENPQDRRVTNLVKEIAPIP